MKCRMQIFTVANERGVVGGLLVEMSGTEGKW